MIKDGRYYNQNGSKREELRFDNNGNRALNELSYICYVNNVLTDYWLGKLVLNSQNPDVFIVKILEESLKIVGAHPGDTENVKLTDIGGGQVRLKATRNGAAYEEDFGDYKPKFREKFKIEFDHEKNLTHTREINTLGLPIVYSNTVANEDLTITTVLERLGLEVEEVQGKKLTAKIDKKGWGKMELHDAMCDFFSIEANKPSWAAWSFIARYYTGNSKNYMGIMFDDFGVDGIHRHGTAIFERGIWHKLPADLPGRISTWIKYMKFFITLHELGHAFNLVHSHEKKQWQAWWELENVDGAPSFMSYISKHDGATITDKYENFFEDFKYQFTRDEVRFIRHAPEQFVKMGMSAFGINHGFTVGPIQKKNLELRIHMAHNERQLEYMEPVLIEYSLTNHGKSSVELQDYITYEYGEPALSNEYLSIIVHCETTGETGMVFPMYREFLIADSCKLSPGESLTGSVFVSMGPEGWLIKEKGNYKIQAEFYYRDEELLSEVIPITVNECQHGLEDLSESYFTPAMAKVMAFDGSKSKVNEHCNSLLQTISDDYSNSRLAIHANIALAMPIARTFKRIDFKEQRIEKIPPDIKLALKYFLKAFRNDEVAKVTLGENDYKFYRAEYDRLIKQYHSPNRSKKRGKGG